MNFNEHTMCCVVQAVRLPLQTVHSMQPPVGTHSISDGDVAFPLCYTLKHNSVICAPPPPPVSLEGGGGGSLK